MSVARGTISSARDGVEDVAELSDQSMTTPARLRARGQTETVSMRSLSNLSPYPHKSD